MARSPTPKRSTVVGVQTRSPAQRRGSVAATVFAAALAHALLLGVFVPSAAALALAGLTVGVAAA
jgi:hypothetical protein